MNIKGVSNMANVKLTKGGVCYDLKITPFRVKINYTSNNYIIYFFSSEFYKNKFEEELGNNRDVISKSLSNRFGFEIQNDILCDIRLYSSIEKRGFYIKNNKEGFEWLDILKLDGKNLILKN